MIDLSIIIVNYNVKEFLLNLLESIQHASKNITKEIIVVDNNSDDGSIQVLKEKFPTVKLIENKENIGFGAANNQAMEIAKGEYLLLINPDTLVKENTFDVMINFLKENPKVGIAGCKVLNPDGTLQLPCRRSFPGPWVSFTKVVGLSKLFPNSKLFAKYNLTYMDENKSHEVDAVSGSFMMLTREAYNKVGGFDTDFFMYGEDLDLCYRIQKNGMKVYYVSDTEIIHYKGESTKRSKIDETKIFYNAMHLFVKKHFSSSFLIEAILQFGIVLRKLVAFANLNRIIFIGILLDFILFFLSIKFSESLYANSRWPGFPEMFKPWVYIVPASFQIIVSSVLGAYKRNTLSVLRSTLSLFLGLIIITSLTFFLKQYAFSRAVVLLTYGFSILSFSIWRIFYKLVIQKKGAEDSPMNTVLIGKDEKTLEFAKKLKSNLTGEYNIIGLIGLDMKDIGESFDNLKVIGSIKNLKKIISDKKIHNIIFPSESIGFNKMFSTIAECQDENVNFMLSGSELDYMVGKSNITHIENIPLLKVQYNISMTTHKIIKRLFDFIGSFLLLITVYPFVIVFSKLSSKSKTSKSNLLSLPSVFIGKKSFVGPREKSFYSNLFIGKIGLTGFWFTENVDVSDKEENNRLDLFYAKNQNIWLDLEIIGKSIAKHFITGRKNA